LHTIVLVLSEWVQLETVGRDSIDQGSNSEQATTTGQSSLALNYYCQSSLGVYYIGKLCEFSASVMVN
jgi:hypothetical protein